MSHSAKKDKLFELITIDDNFESLPSQSICKEFLKEQNLLIPDQKPNIEQLSKILIKPEISNKKVIATFAGRKIILQGHIMEKIFYIANSPQQSVNTAQYSFSFSNFIKLPPKTNINSIKVRVEDIILEINNQKINQSILLCLCIVPKNLFND
ncbi:hypothetical protein Halha_1273 [Halobacteroides halobius DSM 5150]|uniref:SipL SPOCS domain-containing protein n=1 Tax=Halobacteroides halobius (strain ATCC 35273 / DSM 5150 / MD-1) TaxID=748449 RepID=L0KA20_HALHC|nr:DUF3794 domain-containing protein [Halobacteroides halobius]AGB41219.1 hypothetical protein Halha_1273 [Halobacteroides halobius DSM 5150]